METYNLTHSGQQIDEAVNANDFYKGDFYVCDANGNVIMSVTKDGVKSVDFMCGDNKLSSLNTLIGNRFPNKWYGKVLATYGDSVTAINNGNWQYPYVFDDSAAGNGIAVRNWMWGNRVADYYHFSKQYGRGIGGQWWKWQTTKTKADGSKKQGGDLCKFNNATGCGGAVSGTDTGTGGNLGLYDYDDYLANPSIITLGENEVACRGSMCSWNRIQTSFPASIKDTIDVVFVMCHNDGKDDGNTWLDMSWVANDTTDKEWAASGADYYGKVNGDYNINTLKGAIASTAMKLQLWMPNAVIVVGTPISGSGAASGQLNPSYNGGLFASVDPTKEISKKISIPCIDVYGTDGINGINRTSYIADSIHPYTKKGSIMVSRAIIGGLKCIEPMDIFND